MTIVAVFSGGGVKAVAHVGALRALIEAGLTPARYVGTSMGAVIGAAVAGGLTPELALERLQRVRQKDITARNPLTLFGGLYLKSLLRPAALRRTIERLLPIHQFDRLVTPLTVTAVDLDSGELVPFGFRGHAAPLIDVLEASCALPVYYPPVVLDGRRLADGGLRAVLPLEAAQGPEVRLVAAIDTGPGFDESGITPGAPLPAVVRAHDDATGILMAANTQAQVALWRADPERPPLLYVRPRVERGATFRLDLVAHYAEEGYRATREALAERDIGVHALDDS